MLSLLIHKHGTLFSTLGSSLIYLNNILQFSLYESCTFFFFKKEAPFFFFNNSLFYLFIFGCVGSSFLCEGFLQLRQAGASSLSRPLLLRSTGSRRADPVVVTHGPSCSAACGIFPDQGSNPCPLHWQADSQPLRHQGSPLHFFC